MILTKQNTVGWIYLLPFLIFFTTTSVTLLQLDHDAQTQQDSSIFNQIIFSFSYLLAIKLALKKKELISWMLSRAIPLYILFFLILCSLFWSDFPGKVVVSLMHNIGLAFIAMCMAILLLQDKDKTFKLLLILLFIYILTTIVISLLRPDIALMTSANIYDVSIIGRWKGLTGHPNTLGAICIFTNWVALSTFFYTNNKKWISLLSIITLIATFYCLYKANSITSILLSTALVLGNAWFAFINKSNGSVKLIKIILGIFIIIISLMVFFIINPELFTEKYFFSAIGRDSSISGRSSLWDLGFKGFFAKPLLGWSYDSLRTFLSQYHLGFGQLHNGYLDLLVRGGLVSIFFFALLIVQLFYSLLRLARIGNNDYIIFAGLVAAVLMHNMSEASILRNTSLMWLLFLMSYFYSIGVKGYRRASIGQG